MRRIAGLPVVQIPAEELPTGYNSGWISPPGVHPRYRTLAAYNNLRKLPKTKGLRRLKMPGGDWHVLGAVHDGKRWVNAFAGGFRVVISALAEMIGTDLKVPEALLKPAAGKPRPDAKPARKRARKRTAKKS